MKLSLRRFSLRTGLVLLTICAIGCAWFAKHWAEAKKQKSAVAEIQAAGGRVGYGTLERRQKADDSPGLLRNWLGDWLGKDFFEPVTSVWFNGPKDAFQCSTKALSQLPDLREVTILGLTDVSPQSIRELRNVAGLRELSIVRQHLSEEILDALAELNQLEELSICYLNSNDTMAGLAKMRHLKSLYMSWNLNPMVGDVPPADELASILTELPQLKSLSLFGTDITDAGLRELCRLNQLEQFTVGSQKITGASIPHVAKMSQLKFLGAWGWDVNDQDLTAITPQSLPSLTGLDWFVKNATDDGVKHLAQFNLEMLRLSGNGISDEALRVLQKMKSLERLDVGSTAVDPLGNAVKEFKTALPDCRLQIPKTKKQLEMERSFNNWRFGGMGQPAKLAPTNLSTVIIEVNQPAASASPLTKPQNDSQ